MARTRAKARSAAVRSSARITPRLAESPTGFTTQGKPTAESASGPDTSAKRGCDTSARPSAWRIACLSRVALTAAGGLCGKPSRSPQAAATSTPWSSTATTASSGARAWRATTASVAAATSESGTTTARSPMSSASACASSDPTTTSMPRCAAAHEIGRPVGRGGEEEENAWHRRIMVSMSTNAVSPVLTITEEARAKVLEVRAAEPEADTLALWVEVNGEQAGAYTYLMEFRPQAELAADVLMQHDDELAVAIPAESVDKLRGATLELNGGMVMQNPNRPQPAAAAILDRPVADLSGEVPQRVMQVLEEQINPAIASHGGHAELVAVEGNIAYLRLSGGCQGCGMASVTLSQGIEVAILDSVPEITEVVDVTDHATGANPYYEAAKK